MASDTQLKVTLVGDSNQLQDMLQQAGFSIADFGKKAADSIDSIGPNLMKMALGFGTMAAAADKAAGMIIDGLKSIVSYVPNCIEKTMGLTETYKGLAITAGMSTRDFNAWNAAIELSGGKAEDLTSLVQGMERGIKQHSAGLIANKIAVDETALSHMTLAQYVSTVVAKMENLSDPTKKDQLLMEAFGKSGMQFASMLVEVNKHLQEGQELTAAGGSITERAIADLERHKKAQGELNIQVQLNQALVSGASTGIMDSWHGMTAAALKYSNESTLALNAASAGHIKLKTIVNESMHTVDYDYKQMIKDLEAFNKELDEAVKSSKDFLDAGVNPTKNKENFESDAQREQKAADAKQKAADALRAENENIQKRNSLIQEGTELTRKDFDLKIGITVEDKKQIADAKAQNDLEDNLAKIKDTVGGSKNKEVLAQANADRIAAQKLLQDTLKRNEIEYQKEIADIKTKANAEALSGDVAHQKALLAIDLEKINAAKAMHQISDNEAALQTKATEDKIYQLELSDLTRKLALYKTDLVERQRVLNQIQALQDAHIKQQVTASIKGDSEMVKLQRQTMDSIENSMARSFTQMITHGMSFQKALKSIWASVTEEIISSLIKMGVHHMMLAAIEAFSGKASTVAAGEKVAAAQTSTTATVTANTAASTSETATVAPKITSATAGFFSAFSSIPFVGIGLALAAIAAMMIVMKSITAHAVGGEINKPTLSLMGEAGPEIVAPKKDFMQVTKELIASGAGMYKSIVASQAYTNQTMSQNGIQQPKNTGGHTFNIAGNIFASSLDGQRAIQQMVNNATFGLGRAQG